MFSLLRRTQILGTANRSRDVSPQDYRCAARVPRRWFSFLRASAERRSGEARAGFGHPASAPTETADVRTRQGGSVPLTFRETTPLGGQRFYTPPPAL